MARSCWASILIAAAALSACAPGSSDDSGGYAASIGAATSLPGPHEAECGPNVIELLVDRDPEVVALSDHEVGARWLARVQCLADRGDAESRLKLAIAYRDGSDGPPQDYAKAAHWFRLAAEQADPMAQYNLAVMYYEGTGVSRDLVQAYVWYSLAASGFDWKDLTRPSAFAGRDRVAAQLSATEVELAQRVASEWWSARNRSPR